MEQYLAEAVKIVERCRALAAHTEEPGHLTRTFLSNPMRAVHADVHQWMEEAGLQVQIDHAGNIRGHRSGSPGPALLIGSHLDTVPHAGAYDGPLGVLLGIALAQAAGGQAALEIIGFSEEE